MAMHKAYVNKIGGFYDHKYCDNDDYNRSVKNIDSPNYSRAKKGNSSGIEATPAPLQTFDAIVLSAACSSNAVSPAPAPATTATSSSRVTQTSFVTLTANTVFSTSIVSTDATARSGTSTTTGTAPTATLTVTRTITATNSLTLTLTTTTFAISTSTSTTRSTTSSATSSTISSTSSESTSSAVPTVILDAPIAILGSSTSAPEYVDDASVFVDLPFPVQIGQNASSRVYVTSNGILALYDGTTSFGNVQLPVPFFTVPALFPLWDDSYIAEGQPQGIFYKLSGGTDVVFEYYLTHFGSAEYYHYLVSYSTTRPGVFIFTYYQISDRGIGATVGAQYGSPSFGLQFSVNSATIDPGLVLTVDTLAGTITQSSTTV
ncbi:MAG: hypothetical protein Q9178_004390 [Gyalolechia marmorata]